ncbi:MAG TPA: hybrid sensor histidine kinase/response regulator [Planctomycetota bacterium]|nr:hybrid sensor histidine kinase/response regulator [Planctomycetota bacterium]
MILVVDDEEPNRALVRATLGDAYTVVEAEEGRAAIELFDRASGRGPADLVLLDVMMPGLDGFDTCRAIKARARGAFLPVVLCTALDSQEDRNKGLDAGADDFLSKPFDRRELTLRVKALLRVRQQDDEIRRQLESLSAKEEVIRTQLEELQHLQVLKDDLFSLLVHDLRNPLSGVIGFLEILQLQLRDPSQARARQSADQAVEAARRLRDMLDEVLEIQRLEEAGLPIRRERVELRDLIRDAVRTVAGAARSRDISVEVALDEELFASLDRTLVRRAIENLVGNAIKFSPPRETVQVRARRDGGTIAIEVADRGPGISTSTKLRIFKKFAAVEANHSGDRRRGFGLGLHLVKLVASAHGGGVAVRDNEGGGSVFSIAFPEG